MNHQGFEHTDVGASDVETWFRPRFDFAFPMHLHQAREHASLLASRYFVLCSNRQGGVSKGDFESMNLGRSQGDDLQAVSQNRQRLESFLPWPSRYMRLCHGHACIRIDPGAKDSELAEADAVLLCDRGVSVVMLTGDCLPIVLVDDEGHAMCMIHAGWRGLASGVIETAVTAMRKVIASHASMIAWIGPCIGASAFEVGEDVLQAFTPAERSHQYFRKRLFEARNDRHDHSHHDQRWMGNLLALARRRLRICGVGAIGGGLWCTWHDQQRYFSHRRQSGGGRFATVIAML